MTEIVKVIIVLITMIAMPLLLITLFSKLDTDIGDKIRASKKDIFIIILVAIIYMAVTMLFNFDTARFMNMSILTGYLVFMSYTDQKTRLLYSIVSIFMILFETIWLAVNFSNICFTKYHLLLIPIILAMLIMSKFRLLGFGDVLIYVVITIYELTYSLLPFWDILLNYLVANTLFVVIAGVVRIVTKDKEKHQPFTLYIAIATFLCNLFVI